MKSTKNLILSIILLTTLSSFGLINHSDLLKSKSEISKMDSLNKVNSLKNTPQMNIKPLEEKEFNKQKQEEDTSKKASFLSKISYFILLGFKTILKFALKLYSL